MPNMFAVDDLDETLARLGKRGARLVGEPSQCSWSWCSSAFALSQNQRISYGEHPGCLESS